MNVFTGTGQGMRANVALNALTAEPARARGEFKLFFANSPERYQDGVRSRR